MTDPTALAAFIGALAEISARLAALERAEAENAAKLCPLCRGAGQTFISSGWGGLRPLPCRPCGSQGWLLVRFAPIEPLGRRSAYAKFRTRPRPDTLCGLHPLTARFAKLFRRLPEEERERVAQQLLGFLGSFVAHRERVWERLLFLEGEETLSMVSGRTLAELMTEAGIEPGTTRKSS